MNPKPRRLFRLSAVFGALAATAAPAQAHPGHDGHELTWDFGHLAEHPGATLGCLFVLAAATWIAWKLIRRANLAVDQSLRGSQPSRGK